MEDISHASWDEPKKRTSFNGRAALKLMRWMARGVLIKRQVMRASDIGPRGGSVGAAPKEEVRV